MEDKEIDKKIFVKKFENKSNLTIFDVGTYDGKDSLEFNKLFPKANIWRYTFVFKLVWYGSSYPFEIMLKRLFVQRENRSMCILLCKSKRRYKGVCFTNDCKLLPFLLHNKTLLFKLLRLKKICCKLKCF